MGGRGTSSGSSIRGRNNGSTIGGLAIPGGGGTASFQMAQNPPDTAATPQIAAQENDSVFSATDDSAYHQLHSGAQYFQKQSFTVSQQMGIMDYIDPDPTPGSLYSASQNLNYAMMNGLKLDAQQAYMASMMNSAMHNLGYNVNLTRYDHAGYANNLLRKAGLNMNTASVSQMQQALVGRQFSENRFLSTSYNDFKNAPKGEPFTSRQVKITYRAKAGVQSLMPGDTTNKAGVRQTLGEIVVAPNTSQRIVGVREISARGARPKGTPPGTKGARQIEIIIELG